MQFTVYPMPRERPGYVVDVQSRLLEDLATRVVIPLIPKDAAPRPRQPEDQNPAMQFDALKKLSK